MHAYTEYREDLQVMCEFDNELQLYHAKALKPFRTYITKYHCNKISLAEVRHVVPGTKCCRHKVASSQPYEDMISHLPHNYKDWITLLIAIL